MKGENKTERPNQTPPPTRSGGSDASDEERRGGREAEVREEDRQGYEEGTNVWKEGWGGGGG